MPLPLVPFVLSEWQMSVGEPAAIDGTPSQLEPSLPLDPPARRQ